MRVFWAVPLPDALCRELHGIAAGVKGLRAQKPETIHLTLRFLGDIEDPQPVAEAAQAVAARHEPFTLAVCGLGVFPHPRAPRVFWAGVGRGRGAVQALAEDLSEALQPLGFEPERRPWSAHVTLGRFRRPPRLPADLVDSERSFGDVPVERMVLYSSTLTPSGAMHEPVRDLSLGRAT